MTYILLCKLISVSYHICFQILRGEKGQMVLESGLSLEILSERMSPDMRESQAYTFILYKMHSR